MHYKKEFRYLLERLNIDIIQCLDKDDNDKAEFTAFVIPRFYRLASRFWCTSFKNYLKK